MMLVSCSGDVFICPELLPLVLANRIIARLQTPKSKPISKTIGKDGRFGPILGPVFLEVVFLGNQGNRNRPTQPLLELRKHRNDEYNQSCCCVVTCVGGFRRNVSIIQFVCLGCLRRNAQYVLGDIFVTNNNTARFVNAPKYVVCVAHFRH